MKDFEKAIAIFRTGEAVGARGIVLGRMLAILGWFYSYWFNSISVREVAKAVTVAKESLDLLRRLGAQEETVMPLLCLAMNQESLEESGRLLRESLTLARQFGDQWAIGDALYDLGAYEAAEEQFQQGLMLLREMGLRPWTSVWLFSLGKVAVRRGDYAHAFQQYQEGLAAALEFDELDLVAQNHDALARLHMAQAAGIRAREHSQAALRTAIPLSRPPILLASMATIAELLAEEGGLDYAALLAMFIMNHPASQAKIKERAASLLTHLEAHLSADDLSNLRQRSRQSDLDSVAAQLLVDIKTP